MALDWPLRFGAFFAPFHPVGQSPTLALDVLKQSGANTVEVSKAVRERLTAFEDVRGQDVRVTGPRDGAG